MEKHEQIKKCFNFSSTFLMFFFSLCYWMQIEPVPQAWMVSRNKEQTQLKVSISGTPFFSLVKMSISDCFTCLCSAHSFVGAWKLQRKRLQTIICQMWKRFRKKQPLFTSDQHYQSHIREEKKVYKKEEEKKKKTCERRDENREPDQFSITTFLLLALS